MGELHWACNSKISYHPLIEMVSNLFMLISVFLAYDKQNSSAWATLPTLSRMITGISISCVATVSLIHTSRHEAYFK